MRSERSSIVRLRMARLGMALILTACVESPEWSPLEGPWDPNHPDAVEILRPPEVTAPIDVDMAEAGAHWYRVRGCLACHTVDGREAAAGPSLLGVTRRRDYDWFEGMVMRPDSMLRVDPIAKELLEIYRVPMPVQRVNHLHVRAIWEYLRSLEADR
jgi:mono/diheme cytochrome c family protein